MKFLFALLALSSVASSFAAESSMIWKYTAEDKKEAIKHRIFKESDFKGESVYLTVQSKVDATVIFDERAPVHSLGYRGTTQGAMKVVEKLIANIADLPDTTLEFSKVTAEGEYIRAYYMMTNLEGTFQYEIGFDTNENWKIWSNRR